MRELPSPFKFKFISSANAKSNDPTLTSKIVRLDIDCSFREFISDQKHEGGTSLPGSCFAGVRGGLRAIKSQIRDSPLSLYLSVSLSLRLHVSASVCQRRRVKCGVTITQVGAIEQMQEEERRGGNLILLPFPPQTKRTHTHTHLIGANSLSTLPPSHFTFPFHSVVRRLPRSDPRGGSEEEGRASDTRRSRKTRERASASALPSSTKECRSNRRREGSRKRAPYRSMKS